MVFTPFHNPCHNIVLSCVSIHMTVLTNAFSQLFIIIRWRLMVVSVEIYTLKWSLETLEKTLMRESLSTFRTPKLGESLHKMRPIALRLPSECGPRTIQDLFKNFLFQRSSAHLLEIGAKNKYYVISMYVIGRTVSWEVAWNVNKFCVYVFPSSLFMLSNIADSVNKHKPTWVS